MMVKRKSKKDSWELVDWKSYSTLLVAGADEVGRGCLAGPVYAAAVILRPDSPIEGLTDSKLITPEKRNALAEMIKEKSLAWSVAHASVEEIDAVNILRASLLAMRRAVETLQVKPEFLLIDGNQKIGGPWRQETIIKGDLRCQPISAASILAKVARDRYMSELDGQFPGYGFAEHKGYGTPVHKKALIKLGPSILHRKTFAGVKEFFEQDLFMSADRT